jgi:DNA-directed RNA polymerase subunit RPC12/RpoP
MSYYCSACVVEWSPQQTDRGQCPTCGGGTVRRLRDTGDERIISRLELAETAHMAARLCWMWPDDHEQRTAAIQACDTINVDYIGALAKVMLDTGASAHVARRELAEALRKAADRIYAIDGWVDEHDEDIAA